MKNIGQHGLRARQPGLFSRHISPDCTIRGEIWLEKNGRIYMDNRRVNLLRMIDKYGSLAAAARSIKMGYNTAWLWIISMNHLSSTPLVERSTGGINGGYSRLTRQGYEVIENYTRLNGNLKEAINESSSLQFRT